MLSAGTTGCRVMTAEALRAAVAAGPALAALLGLVFLSSLEGETASAMAGRAAVCGLLGPAGRPNERSERAALAGLCAWDRRGLPGEAPCAEACSTAVGVSTAARSFCNSRTESSFVEQVCGSIQVVEQIPNCHTNFSDGFGNKCSSRFGSRTAVAKGNTAAVLLTTPADYTSWRMIARTLCKYSCCFRVSLCDDMDFIRLDAQVVIARLITTVVLEICSDHSCPSVHGCKRVMRTSPSNPARTHACALDMQALGPCIRRPTCDEEGRCSCVAWSYTLHS